ncbi:MAG: pilus assembly protein [Methyloceanibacter sp.]|nr:pilus assembly protein [Methyloceanibacter sp.]
MKSSLSHAIRAVCGIDIRKRFLRNERGGSALEFALVAGPLIFLLLAVIQVGYVYFANFALDSAVAAGARLIRTGQVKANEIDASLFKEAVCNQFVGPLSCGKLALDVRSYDDFSEAAAGLTPALDDEGNVNNNTNFDPGNAEEVVVIRAFYPLELASLFPPDMWLNALQNMDNGDRLLVSTAAFRNEPYE